MNEPFHAYIERNLGADPVLIACGLPASYKTETTEVIAKLKGYRILRTDLIRLEVLKDEDIFDEKVAGNFQLRTRVYDEMFSRAHHLAQTNTGVILDATFVTQELRRRAAKVAADNRKTFVISQTSCPAEVSLKRISLRTREHYESNAIAPVAYHNNVKKFQAMDLEDLKTRHPDLSIIHLMIDTTSNEEQAWRVIQDTRV